MWKALKSWWRAVANRSRVEREMDEELRFHVEAYARDLVQKGSEPEEAMRRARMEFGGIEQAKEECREAKRLSAVESILQDIRFALRMFRTTPTMTAAAILTLALGIGANTAIFSLIDRVMLAKLPVAKPQELMQLSFRNGGGASREPMPTFTNTIWEVTRARQDVFTDIFAWDSGVSASDLAQGGAVDLADRMFVSGGYFEGLGVGPERGRLIEEADDRRGCTPVAVLSYAFWQARYGGREDVIGKTISLDRHPIPIIGVSEAGFTGLVVGRKFDVAIPICSSVLFDEKESRLDHRSWWWLNIMGRVKPGLTVEQVNARLETLSPQVFQEAVPFKWKKDGQDRFMRNVLVARPGQTGVSDLRREYEKPLAILMGVVGLVLLIACANIASLMLARAITRTKELAVRKALGASRTRLVRQLLTESILLAGMGALLGIMVAHWGNRVLVRFLSTSRQQVFLDFPLDLRVLAFTIAVSLLAAILFGLLPAFRATAVSLTAAMKGSHPALEGRMGYRAGRWIVAFQVAISLVLLITAGLFLRSFVKLSRVDAGFDRSNVVLISAGLKDGNVPEQNRFEVARQIDEALGGIPGVTSASASLLTPIGGATWNDNVILNRPGAPTGDDSLTYINYVSPRYLETMRIPLLAGRDFDEHDTATSPHVAIINDTMARRFFTGLNPIGQIFKIEGPPGAAAPDIQVVGVMRDAKYEELSEATLPQAFLPLNQLTEHSESLEFVVRAGVDLAALIPSVVSTVSNINKGISLHFKTLSEQVDDSLARDRVLATLSGFFGGLALLLAMIGLYGALSYVVTQRQAEFGVRRALGAPAGAILKLVLVDLFFVLGIGVVSGVLISIAAVGVLQKMLFGLAARDSATIVGAVMLITGVAVAASLVPARRAMRVDPAEALRYE